MFKKLAAIGLSAALALSPLAALAQSATPRRPAPAPATAAPAASDADAHARRRQGEARPRSTAPLTSTGKQESAKMKPSRRPAPAAPRRRRRAAAPASDPERLIDAMTSGPKPASFRARPVPRTGRFFCRAAAVRLPAASAPVPSSRPNGEEPMAAAEFWYEFASTYSYPAAMRVAALAAARGVTLVWRPFLLGPIFAAQGWRDSPFNLYPAKGRYMWRDLERICARAGPAVPAAGPLPAKQPARRPRRARARGRERAPSSRARVYAAEFGEGRLDRRSRPDRRRSSRNSASTAGRRWRARRATPTRRSSRPNAPAPSSSAFSAPRAS